ncbi:MAG: RecX family transcriptional regulator [Methylophaga sp.]|nr:MAG: RecX family transcriptional regulator [Methylophaga sp.]
MSKQSLRERAMNFLARREHSVDELITKLVKAEFDRDDVLTTIARLTEQDLQSDQRFAENYTRYRSNRGFGDQKIRQELKERGVAVELINDTLDNADIDWFALATTVKCKRFGEQKPGDIKERAKQQRFLHYRGFTHEQINESFR